jgi:hypothetical protein
MADATAPYCESSDVKALMMMHNQVAGADFPASGVPPIKSGVESLINMVASRIDMAYASVGYVIPFTAISGETWSDHQTSFLQYFNAMGVAAMFVGTPDTPQIAAMRPGRFNQSQYQMEWNGLINGVKAIGKRNLQDAMVLVRAQTRTGSPAEWMLAEPYPPLSNFLEGYYDPMRTDMLREFVDRWRTYYSYMKSLEVPVSSDPTSVHWLYWWHYRLGNTYVD